VNDLPFCFYIQDASSSTPSTIPVMTDRNRGGGNWHSSAKSLITVEMALNMPVKFGKKKAIETMS
jgi:hypothetical protein